MLTDHERFKPSASIPVKVNFHYTGDEIRQLANTFRRALKLAEEVDPSVNPDGASTMKELISVLSDLDEEFTEYAGYTEPL